MFVWFEWEMYTHAMKFKDNKRKSKEKRVSHLYTPATKFPFPEVTNVTIFLYIFQKYSVDKQACTCTFILFCFA